MPPSTPGTFTLSSPSTTTAATTTTSRGPVVNITRRITHRGESYDCSLQSNTPIIGAPSTPQHHNHSSGSLTPSSPSTPRIRWQLKIFSVRLNEMYSCTVGHSEYLQISRGIRKVVRQPTKLFQLVKDALFQQQQQNPTADQSASSGNLSFSMYYSSNASLDNTTDLDSILDRYLHGDSKDVGRSNTTSGGGNQDSKAADVASSTSESFYDNEIIIDHDELFATKGPENYHRRKMLLRIEYSDEYVAEGFHFWILLNRHTLTKSESQRKLRKESKQMMHSISMLQIENKTQNHVIQSIQTDMSILQQDHQNQNIQSQILQSDFKVLRKENKHLTQIVQQLSNRIKSLEETNAKIVKENATIKQYIQNIIALQGTKKTSTTTAAITPTKGPNSPSSAIVAGGGAFSQSSSNNSPSVKSNMSASQLLHHDSTEDLHSLRSGREYANPQQVDYIPLDTFWDPDKTYVGVGLSNQNRTAVNTKKYWTSCLANGILSSGSYRVTIRLDNVGYRNSIFIGVSDPSISLINVRCGDTENSWGLNCHDGYVWHAGQKRAYLTDQSKELSGAAEIRDGTLIHMLIDMDAATIQYQIGNINFGVAFGNVRGPVAPMCSLGDYGVCATIVSEERLGSS